MIEATIRVIAWMILAVVVYMAGWSIYHKKKFETILFFILSIVGFNFFFLKLGATIDPASINYVWAVIWTGLTVFCFIFGDYAWDDNDKEARRFFDGLGTFLSLGIYFSIFS